MARDLFAEIGYSPAAAGPRDLFAEIGFKPAASKPAEQPASPRQDHRQSRAPAQVPTAPVSGRGAQRGLGGQSGDGRTWSQRLGDWLTEGNQGVSTSILRNAQTGDFARDAGSEEGFFDRAGSILERGAAAVDEGFYNTIAGLTGSEKARERAQTLRQGTLERKIEGKTEWEDVKARPGLGTVGSFVLDTSIESVPGMAAAAVPYVGIPLLGASQTGSIAGERARNNGRQDVTLGDVAKAAPAGFGSAALERMGIESILGAPAKTTIKRIGQAAGGEALTEGVQSFVENAGGTVGTERGFDISQAGEEAFAGALAGAGMGGVIRGGIETVDSTGRLVRRRPGDNRVPGPSLTEQAEQAAIESITPEDEASPLPTTNIARGRAEAAVSAAKQAANGTLGELAMPAVGKRVTIDHGGGVIETGTMKDVFTDETGRGVVIERDGGRPMREYIDNLADAGVRIIEGEPVPAPSDAASIDAELARQAQKVIDQYSNVPSPVLPAIQDQGGAQAVPSAQGSARKGVSGGTAIDDFMARARQAESRGDDSAKNPRSSATGRYQFTDSTWLATYRAEFGNTGESDAQILAKRKDGATQDRLMRRLTTANAKGLEQVGADVTPGNLYLAHFAGINGAQKVLRADPNASVEAVLGASVVKANPFLKDMTAGQLVNWASRKMGGSDVQVAGVAQQPSPDIAQTEPFRMEHTELAAPEAVQAPVKRDDAGLPTIADQALAETAPVAAPAPRSPIPARVEQQSDQAVTVTGQQVPVRYAVVELRDLTPSNLDDGRVNPAFPAERQPRDRTRAASQTQIAEIAANLNPRLLGRSPKVADGAPIISPAGVVESGNGRTLALQRAYSENGANAQGYRAFIESEGFDTAGMDQPVLVRIRDEGMSEADIQSFVRDANARDTAGMSGTETANADASAMPPNLLEMYRGGDIDAAANRGFVRGFMQALVPTNEQADLIMGDGSIAKPLINRIEAALLARAMGPQPFIEKIVDAPDNNIKAIGKALIDVSGAIAQMREAAASGQIDASLDITANIAEAVDLVDRARREGKPLTDYVNQRDIFSGSTVAPETEAVLRLFFIRPDFTRPRSQKRVAEALAFYVEEAMKAAPGGGLFGESTAIQPRDILATAYERDAKISAEQGDLLAAPVRDGGDGQGVQPGSASDAGSARPGILPQSGEEGSRQRLSDANGTEDVKPVQPESTPNIPENILDTGKRAPASNPDQETDSQKSAAPEVEAARAAPADQDPPAPIEDFGEKLHGARKDVWQSYKDRLKDAKDADVQTVPLSQSWPEPDYQKLLDAGADQYAVAAMRAMRDAIPPKPRSYGVVGWAKQVEALRNVAQQMLEDGGIADNFMTKLQGDFSRSLRDLQGAIDLYREFGHERSFKGIRFASDHYSMYRGEKNVTKWSITQKQKANAFSNWPRELAVGDTRDEVLAKFRALVASGGLEKKPSVVRFDIYSRRGQPGFWIGKKIGKDYADLKHFDTAKEARAYKVSNYDDLVAALEKYKDIPPERKAVNSPRIGINHRNGADVTPAMFSDTFGFRGVQFGNYVEGPRRQSDLNQAYDALMDLAGVIGVPPRALSLNGELGLAFGARGKGGKGAAAAHYETGNVVINLTKGAGAGSLAHEWWHSLDNYFGRQRGSGNYVTDSINAPAGNMRVAMADAFKGVMQALRQTSLKERSSNLDKRRTKAYWATDIEMSARAFESYVIAKLADEQFSNDYLANVVSEGAFALEGGYPYPTAAEIDVVRAGFDEFFRTVETKETDQGTALYSIPEGSMESLPVVASLASDVYGRFPPAGKERILYLREQARRWYTDNLQGKTVTAADGKKLTFGTAGRGKSTANKGDVVLRAVPALEALVTQGKISALPDRADRDNQAVMFAGIVEIDGERHRIGAIARIDANGRYHYDLTNKVRKDVGDPVETGGASKASVPVVESAADADFNLVVLDEQSNNAPSRDIDLAALQERLEQVGISRKVALRVVDTLNGAAGDYGAFGERLIRIASDTEQDAGFTLNHEIVHALREMGLFNTSDWSILAAKAKRDPGLMRSIRKRYPRLTSEAQVEEAVADMFARWQRGDYQATGVTQRLFQRLRDMFELVRNVFSGRGARTAEGVMRDVDAGKLGARNESARQSGSDVKASYEKAPDGLMGFAADRSRQRGFGENRYPVEQDVRVTFGDDVFEDTIEGLNGPHAMERARRNWDGATIEAIGEPRRVAKQSIPATTATLAELAGTEPTWKGKAAEAWEKWRTATQDRYLPLLKTQRLIEMVTGKPLPSEANPYMGEELMTGRIGSRLERLEGEHVTPLFDAMAAEKVTVDELESYLYARHAPERNARIAKINPEIPEGGSGMTNIEARAVMNRIRKAGKMEAMERLAARVDALRDLALDYRVETGLMSKEQADEWRSAYQFYVPLRGFAEADGDGALAERMNRSGGGINVRGKESKQAFGRRSKADSPLAYTIMQAEEAIVRGETNRVAQQFVELARKAPDADFWEVNKVTTKPSINEASGLVEYHNLNQLLAADKDWTVSAKFDGKEVRVTMNRDNPTARRLADSMRNLTQQQLGWVTQHLGKVNRFLSAVNTSYNPEFVITNAFRDLQSASINMAGVDVEGIQSGTLRDYPKALVAATKGAFGKGSGEWKRWYDEFTSEGGRVYFNHVEDVDAIKKRMEGAFAMAAAKAGEPGNLRLHTKRGLIALRDFIENVNMGVENAIRLSVYKNAREAGVSKEKAASIAKNITVNFNRRGQLGPAINSAYLFFNASVQGTTRIVTALRSRKVQKLVAGIVIGGALMEMLNAMVSAEDDDGESFYDKIPAFEKSRNIILMLPGGKEYVKVPMPYGYNAFWEAGRSLAEIGRRGGERWQESAGNLATTVVDAFNPVGGSDTLLNFLSPTIADPIVDLALNRDFTGKPIMPNEQPYGPPDPDNQRYFGSVGAHWKAITDFLNETTGGDEVVPGAIDVSPETLEYLSGTVLGAAGAFADRLASIPSKLVEGDLEVNDVPFARKVMGKKSAWQDKGVFWDRLGAVEQAIKDTKDYIDIEDVDSARAYAMNNLAVLSLEADAKQARKDMKDIRKAKRELETAKERGKIDAATYREGKRQVEDLESQVVQAFNTRWNESLSAPRQ